MRLILIRHGETPANVRGELDTAVPGPNLTDRGIFQAAALVERFADTEFDAIYASTQTRSQLTAAPLATDRGMPVHIRDGFREFFVGDLEGKADPASVQHFVQTLKEWILGELEVSMPGGESGMEILERFDTEIADIAAAPDPPKVVTIVSHGGILRLWAVARSSNIDAEFALANYLVNTGVIVMDGSPEIGWNCHSWDLAPGHP